jgi:sugar O-acyltransferase (sialic acid O-acetyltransferase NeuD family)
MKPLVIFGCGDIGQLAHFYFTTDTPRQVAAFTVDAAFKASDTFCGLPVVAFEEVEQRFPPSTHDCFVALSYNQLNQLRAGKVAAARAKGYALATYCSSHATVLTREPLGDNCFILEDNTVQPFVRIGHNVTLWSGNHIGHHSVIEDDCFITSHVVVSGGVQVKPRCFIGVNATLRDHITIGESSIIGAGAVILGDVAPHSLYRTTATELSPIPSHKLRRL